MDAGYIVEHLGDAHPARQHRDIRDEGDVAHELIALGPWVASEYLQCSLMRDQTKDRVQGGGLAGAVWTDDAEDAALLDTQIDAIERDGCAESLAQAVRFYRCH